MNFTLTHDNIENEAYKLFLKSLNCGGEVGIKNGERYYFVNASSFGE